MYYIGYSSVQCIKIGYSSVQCIKIGYSSAQCINIGYHSVQCIKIGYISAQCIKIGYSLAQWIKVWNRVFSALCDSFRHCEIFFIFFAHMRLPGIFLPPASLPYACAPYRLGSLPLTLPYNFSPKQYCVSIRGGGDTRSPTGTRTFADGVPDAITFFVVELWKRLW